VPKAILIYWRRGKMIRKLLNWLKEKNEYLVAGLGREK